MSNLEEFTTKDFEAEVLNSNWAVIVDFSAEWCGPCKAMAPLIDQLATQYDGQIKVGMLDVDANPDIAMKYNVFGMPTLGLYKDGKLVDRMQGFLGTGKVKMFFAKAAGVEA